MVIAQRFHFYRRNQAATESIAAYVAELRRLSAHCDFAEFLDSALRDRLVCGIRSESAQKRLLSEADLTLKKAMELAQGMEAADKNAKSLKESDPAIRQITKFKPNTQSTYRKPCSRCGKTNHDAQNCRFAKATCHACGKIGHIAPACRSSKGKKQRSSVEPPKSRGRNGNVNHLPGTDSEDDNVTIFTLGSKASQPISIEVTADQSKLSMEVDTGAAVSIISQETWKYVFPKHQLQPSKIHLQTYTKENISVIGEFIVQVSYNQKQAQLPLVVVPGDGPSLLGSNWLKPLNLDLQTINSVLQTNVPTLENLLENYQKLFNDELGKIQPYQAKLKVRPDAQPKFFKARPVPFANKPAIEQELDRLEGMGAIVKIPHSEWAAPIVPVPKKDGKFRLCGDYKVTVNQALDMDQYPLPKPDDLFASLAGGKQFTKLDLSQAYQQLQLDEDSVKYATINTHRGLYQVNRLPFGIASAPAMFQQLMDTILQGIPHVICYIDDILVTGSNTAEHLQNLTTVFKRLENHGIRMKKSKCEFLQVSVYYLGHKIDAEGLHAIPSKVDAIVDAPEPQNLQELRSFLGLLNYYGKFIPNLSSLIHPLNSLLQQDRRSTECSRAFKEAKMALVSSKVLVHYDPSLPVTLAGDASAYGIGAVISHTMPDGSERPIAFASRTLSTSEKNYAQIEKEALSLIFGVKKFHRYLYGRKFTLVTDRKPLLAIFKSNLNQQKSMPMQIVSQGYRYPIKPICHPQPVCSTTHKLAFYLSQVHRSLQQPKET